MPTLRNVNPIGYTDLPMIGRVGPSHDESGGLTEAGSGCLMPGEEFEVTKEQAGVAPFWRPVKPTDYELDGRLLVASRTNEDGDVEVLDPGHGLLALVGIFEPAVDDDLGKLTVPALKEYAAEHGIDLGAATTKSAILAAIRKG